MKRSRTHLFSVALVVLSFVLAGALYDRLPEWLPTHWNVKGQADGFMPKPWGPFVLPMVMAGVYLVTIIVPRISPRGYRVERFHGVFEIFLAAIMAFFFMVTVLVLLAGIGKPVPMDRAIFASTGLLLVVLGNYMGKVTKNFFVGIRTPWTLASDEVWLKTHRLGGKLFVLAGIIMFVSGLLGGGVIPHLAAVAIAGGVPIAYSYFVYRRIEGFHDEPPRDGSHRST